METTTRTDVTSEGFLRLRGCIESTENGHTDYFAIANPATKDWLILRLYAQHPECVNVLDHIANRCEVGAEDALVILTNDEGTVHVIVCLNPSGIDVIENIATNAGFSYATYARKTED